MSVIDEIKGRLDIVDIVSDYATLQKSGRNFKAICPFHTEKTPSFFVFPERGSWHCFGSCGTGGDIFSFIMKQEDIDFGTALRILAERAGVTMVSKREERNVDKETERLYLINAAAAQYFHHLLLNAKAAETARRHLSERGISKEIIDIFELGSSPNSWDALCQHLKSRGYDSTTMVSAGLSIAKEGGGFRDLFRNRLMIPIRILPNILTPPRQPSSTRAASFTGSTAPRERSGSRAWPSSWKDTWMCSPPISIAWPTW